jgi:hypothetical protein
MREQDEGETMKRTGVVLAVAAMLGGVGATMRVYAQDQPYAEPASAPEANVVPAGTRFLIGLQDKLSTQEAQAGNRFHARTLEPLTTGDGKILPPGLEVRGHVDKVEAAHETGRARLWLTFDDVKMPNGWMPLVAVVSDIPGVHSAKVDYDREGEIESPTSKRQEEAEAAAAGAFVGAAPGVAAHNAKGMALGAAAGAVTGFMVASGLGQELTLQKNTKLELVLDRPLYIGRT